MVLQNVLPSVLMVLLSALLVALMKASFIVAALPLSTSFRKLPSYITLLFLFL